MATRFLIGKGELLTYDIPPPPMVPNKVHPYGLTEAKAHLVPQMALAALELQQLPQIACPSDVAVAKVDLHPAYIAKSFFPTALLRQAGLTAIGSRTIRVRPRKDLRKKAPPECESTQLFVAGTREAFARLPSFATQISDHTKEALQFAEIEDFSTMTAADRVRTSTQPPGHTFEVGLHLLPDQSVDALRKAFVRYAKTCEFEVNGEFDFPVGRMLFLAAIGEAEQLQRLAQFSLLRVVRPMPLIRGSRPFARGNPISVGFSMPTAQPLSDEPTVAILDGGLPDTHILTPFLGRYEKSDPDAADLHEDVDAPLVAAFLDDLEASRGITARTRNLRLTAVHSFFRFASYEAPTHAVQIARVLAIPAKKFTRTLVPFMSRAEVDALLAAPDQRTWSGRRDHALLLIAVQTGLRLSELTGIRRDDVVLGTGSHVRVIGKGRKERCTPLSKASRAVMSAWMHEPSRAPDQPVFPNARGGPLSAHGVQYLVAKHVATASRVCTSLAHKRVSPHVLRHTTAMDLVQEGVDRPTLALWLGHESIETTQIYLDADLEMKSKLLDKLTPPEGKPGRYRPDDALLAFLKCL